MEPSRKSHGIELSLFLLRMPDDTTFFLIEEMCHSLVMNCVGFKGKSYNFF